MVSIFTYKWQEYKYYWINYIPVFIEIEILELFLISYAITIYLIKFINLYTIIKKSNFILYFHLSIHVTILKNIAKS